MGFWRNRNTEFDLFEILYRQQHTKLCALAFSITKDRELSRDAVQQAFLKMYRKRDQLKDKGKFSAWAATIVVNEAKNLLKSANRFNLVPLAEITDDMKASRTADSFEYAFVIKDQVKRIFNVLPADDAEILVLRYYLDLTVEEIATILNLTGANVKIRLHRARAHFREAVVLEEAAEDLGYGGKFNEIK
ncbi:RNA polymerase sigma factor [Desulfitobacterium chlororespirans]|uniref:RNA polymerase sigma-70 factor, ECF subfamily n=1 Tax=Desulfitobacterium chlororespirans DSM 11544 TaxID=1121395 RepID=A0A1M7TP41_9FIRM|nr:sigma-70 family RNA polymerase sigma factor [Desulfitobacterium chlororespirans]SHN72502.1 RNA polymerase sigma-70 factor, ECF subfamily [Desulfitobacterium chlororespirans DSM 11544]